MDIVGVRAAQLISEVTPHIFLTAAQVTLQQNSNSSTTSPTDLNNQIKSEICEPPRVMAAVERDQTPASSDAGKDEDAGEEEEFEVEQILDTKMSRNKRLFKVRWKNYGPEWDTWEPEDSLVEGAEESIKEFMQKYENEKNEKKAAKARKRPAKSTTPASTTKRSTSRAQRLTIEDADDEPLPDTASDSEDEGFEPSKSKKTKTNKAKATPSSSSSARTRGRTLATASATKPKLTSATAPSTAASSNGLVSNKTPWFMDSSDSEDEAKKQKRNQTLEDSSEAAAQPEERSSSSLLKLVIPKTKVEKNGVGGPEEANTSEKDGNDPAEKSPKHKKDKHKKKNKKPRVELLFEGIYRRAPGEPLSFIAQPVGSDTSSSFSLEEALETDAKSLGRFLADKITFKSDGIPTVEVLHASTSSKSKRT